MQRTMLTRWLVAPVVASFLITTLLPAHAEDLVLKKGTDVKLEFASSLSSKTSKPGDTVRFKVSEDTKVDEVTVIREGTPVTAKVVKVNKRGRYGTNAKVQLQMQPVRTVSGRYAPLGFKTKGQDISNKTGEAAGATAGAALLLGPIGLVAGYFIPGKTVNAKPGDKMTVNVDKDTFVKVQPASK